MTKYADNHTRAKMVQIGYEELITDPDDTREDLYCLTLPQTKALIAVIDIYRYRTRWWYDDVPDLELLRQFVDDTQRRLMMPCGDDNAILLSTWTPNGHYQESTDGGETYHDSPAKDPRNNVPIPPPFLPPDTLDESCTYADSIVNSLINDWINATGETEDEATVVEGIISFLAGIFGAFGVVAAAITLGIAIVIVAFTVVAWKAAFDSDVWDRLRCNLKNNMGADGSFDQSQVDAVYDQIGTDETGIVRISLQGMVAAMGWQGLTSRARAGKGSPAAECCVESGCADGWTVAFGNEISRTAVSILVEAVFNAPDGVFHAQVTSGDQDICCTIDWELTLEANHSVWLCGDADPTVNGAHPVSGWWVDVTRGTDFNVNFSLTS